MIDLVSVVIPTHNRFEELFRALDSVISQTYKNIEIIVVDDNYNDLELRKKIENKINNEYKNVKCIYKNKHLYGAEARNFGFREAKGEYISFLDDDDEYYNNKIEKQLSFFKNANDDRLSLVYCFGKIIYPSGKIELERTNYRGWPLSIQMRFNIAGTSFWMVRKDALEQVGGFEKITSHQDGVVLLKLLSKGYKIDLCKEDLVKYYFHSRGTGITDVNDKILQADYEYLELCKKYFYMITKKDQRKVLLKYYNDRNWNLIILKKKKEAISDIVIMFKKYFLSKDIFVCIFRIVFSKFYIIKDNKFNKEILLGEKNEK